MKEYLENIQKAYYSSLPPDSLQKNGECKDPGFLFANDNYNSKAYFPQYFNSLILSRKILSRNLESNDRHKLLGIVGSGYLFQRLIYMLSSKRFSFIEDIVVMDIDAGVLFFLAGITKIILSFYNEGIAVCKQRLDEFFYLGCQDIENYKRLIKGFNAEMAQFKDTNFLASDEILRIYGETLKQKEILFINIDLFDPNQVGCLAEALNINNAEFYFLNLTNLFDYDPWIWNLALEGIANSVLLSNIKQFPFSADHRIIFVSAKFYFGGIVAINKFGQSIKFNQA